MAFDHRMLPSGGVTPGILLEKATDLYERGLYLQAERLLRPLGEPKGWEGYRARLFAARLAGNLGGRRLAAYLLTTLFRKHPEVPEVRYYWASHVFSRWGPWSAWEVLRDSENLPGLSQETRSLMDGMRGRICAFYKDRHRARMYLEKALAENHGSAWLRVEESFALEYLDDREAALAAAEVALKMTPCYRPAVQQAATLLLSANRDEEALALLRDASERIESGAVVVQRIVALSERECFAEIPALCDEAQGLLVWAEKGELEWLNARRSDAFYGLKDRQGAAKYAREAGDAAWAERLEEEGEGEEAGRRVKLEVPFVQQAKDTCAPASLASVAAFWGWDVSHDEITKAVCYGGTEVHGLRRWVEERAWVVREFRVTWETTQELIDRGVPFLLVTREAGSGHMQVVEGYDALRRTLLIRDPGFRHHRQVAAGEFLDFYAAFGPQGLVILPPAESHRLQGVRFPAEEGFDRLYHLNCALERHDRDRAAVERDALKSEGPAFLAFEARITLSFYDADEMERLHCLEEMEAGGLRHPRLTAMLLAAQENFSYPSERLATLRKAADPQARDFLSRRAPSFLMTLAVQLAQDERNHTEVRRLVRRYFAVEPYDSGALSFWGGQHWLRKRYEEAVDLFRFAATSGVTLEPYAHEYFNACFLLGREEEALAMLRERAEGNGGTGGNQGRSSRPAQTLYSALRSLHRDEAAFEVLSRALQVSPGDGELLLYAAYEWALSGERERGRAMLNQARDLSKPASWARVAACFGALEGDLEEEAAQWAEVMRLEPLALDAYAAHCRLILAREGPAAALEAGKAKCEAFPHHVGFAECLAKVALEAGDAVAVPFVHEWSRKAPYSFAAHREKLRLALARGQEGEAYFEAREKCAAHPHSSEAALCFGMVLYETGHQQEAREWFRKAVSLNVDCGEAIRYLAALVGDEQQGLKEEAFIGLELTKQVFQGAGLYAWYDFAVHYLSASAMGESLAWLRRSRPNCSAVWGCSLRLSLRHHDMGEALRLAEEATERFGLVAPAWLDLALVLQRAGRLDEAAEALEKGLALDPFLTAAWESLSLLREMQGRGDEALALLEEAIRRNPLDDAMRVAYANSLWRRGRREQAMEAMEAALHRSPKMANGWWCYGEWCQEMGAPQRAIDFLKELAALRPGEVGLQVEYARALKNAASLDKAETLLRQLLEVHRRDSGVHLLLSEILATKGRFAEAMELLTGPIWQESPNVAIIGQAALVEACRGNLPQAVVRIKDAVRRDPSYAWGYEKLRDWHQDRLPDARRFAEKAAEIQPDNAQAWVVWADIEEQLGRAKKALEVHSEAVARNRADTSVALLYIRRLLRHNSVEEAEQVLRETRRFSESEQRAARALIHLARRERREAWEQIEALALEESAGFAFTIVAQWCAEIGEAKHLGKLLSRVVRQPGVRPHGVTLWVEAKLAAGRFNLVRSLRALPEEHGARKAGIEYYLRRLDGSPVEHRASAYRLWRKDGDKIRQDVATWEWMGVCMVAVRARKTRSWTACWRDYPTVKPWALRVVALLLVVRRQFDEAFEVSESAVAQGIYDDTIPFHQLMGCLNLALESHTKEAAEALAPLERVEFEPFCQNLRRIVRLVIDIREVSPRHGRKLWKRGLKALKAEGANSEIVLRRLLRMTAKRLNIPGVRYFSLGRFAAIVSLPPGMRTPQYRWRVLASLAFLVITMLLGFFAGKAGSVGNGGLVAVLLGLSTMTMLAFIIFWLLAQFHYFGEGNKWSLSLLIRALLGSVLPLVAAGGFLRALVDEPRSGNLPPRHQPPSPVPAAESGKVYHHPDGLFSVDLKNAGNVRVVETGEGIGIEESTGVVLITASPVWKWPDFPAYPADFITHQLEKVKAAPNTFLASEVVDKAQVRWLRFGLVDPNGQGERLISMLDITVVRNYLVILQFNAAPGKYSIYESAPLERMMDDWRSRLTVATVATAAAQPATSPVTREEEEMLPLMETEIFQRATGLREQGQHREALPLLQGLRKERPADLSVISLLVDTLSALDRDEEAIELAREAVRIAPEDGRAHGTLGFILLKNRKVEEAIEANRKATELSPKEGAFWFCLGLSYILSGDLPEAIEALTKAVEYVPENEEAWVHLVWAYRERGDFAGAEERVRKLLDLHPDAAAGWYLLGSMQGEMGMRTAGMVSLKKSVGLNPRSMLAWNALGLAHVKKGEFDDAFHAFNEAIRINPLNADPWNNLGYTHLTHQRYPEAQHALEKAIEVDPSFTRAYVNLANTYLKQGDVEAARELCRRLSSVDPSLADNLSLEIEGGISSN